MQEMLRSLADLAQSVGQFGIVGIPQGKPAQADDCAHRRAQFVAHVGEEGAFCTVCRLGGVLGRAQFVGAFLHHCFKMVAMCFQFPFGLLACGNVMNDRKQQGFTVAFDR